MPERVQEIVIEGLTVSRENTQLRQKARAKLAAHMVEAEHTRSAIVKALELMV